MEHPEQDASKPVIILVEPQLGENIGMVARAMANFGLAELQAGQSARRLAERQGAGGGKQGRPCHRRDHGLCRSRRRRSPISTSCYATTARERDGFKPVRAPVEAARTLQARGSGGQRTGILFGRERFGLSNEEIALADEIVTFPVNPAFASLNIAQAVLLMSYEWMKSGLESETQTAFASPENVPGREGTSAGLFRPSRCGAVGARLFPPRREEAENGRQSAAPC